MTAAAMVAGLGIAGATPASARDLGSFTTDCYYNAIPDQYISGQVGDTFTIRNGSATCYLVSSTGGVVSWVTDYPSSGPDPANIPGNGGGQLTATVTLIGLGSTTYTSQQVGVGGTFFVTVTEAAPETASAPIPAWVQAYGIFHHDDACEAGWTNSWQKWAEPVAGGWVCTRSIPSLG